MDGQQHIELIFVLHTYLLITINTPHKTSVKTILH